MRRRASRDGRALESAFPVPVHRGWSSRGRLRLSLLVDARNSRRPESQRVPGNWRARSPDAAAVSLGGIAAVEPAARFSSYEAFSRQPFCMSSNKSESLFETRPNWSGRPKFLFQRCTKIPVASKIFSSGSMFDRHQKEHSYTCWNCDSNELREASFSVQFRNPILFPRGNSNRSSPSPKPLDQHPGRLPRHQDPCQTRMTH